MALPRLELKKGSQVMLIKNQSEFLVNGSMGRVIGFADFSTFQQDPYGNWTGNQQDQQSENETSCDDDGMPIKKKKKPDSTRFKPEQLPVVRFQLSGGELWLFLDWSVRHVEEHRLA